MFSLETVVQRDGGIVASELDGKVVMMSIENGKYYGLDEIGTEIWAHLETATTVGELIRTMAAGYDI